VTSANLETIRDTAVDAMGEVRRAAAPAVKKTKRKAGALIAESGALLDAAASRTRDTASDIGEGLIAYTKKHPITALLLALGAGALLVGAANAVRSPR
jgi:hypothetical protein